MEQPAQEVDHSLLQPLPGCRQPGLELHRAQVEALEEIAPIKPCRLLQIRWGAALRETLESDGVHEEAVGSEGHRVAQRYQRIPADRRQGLAQHHERLPQAVALLLRGAVLPEEIPQPGTCMRPAVM